MPQHKLGVFDRTDAGPGLGANNKPVQYGAAERVMIIRNLDSYAHDGDGQNPVELIQAEVGRAIANGDNTLGAQENV